MRGDFSIVIPECLYRGSRLDSRSPQDESAVADFRGNDEMEDDMNSRELKIDGKSITGIEVELPKAPLVLVRAANGFVMCGYLNVEVAEKLGVSAAMVRGVSSIEDVLNAKVQAATSSAREKGVAIGMTGREALAFLS